MRNVMKFSIFSYGYARFRIALGILAGLALGMQDVPAAWHDEHPGADLAVHYVHLTGYGGNNDVNRRNLLIEHQACVTQHRIFGRAANPLPPSGIPPVITGHDIEIYYASNRVLVVSQGKAYFIDRAACDLRFESKRTLQLDSVIGHCDIDLSIKKAIGACDEKAHEQAPNYTLATIAPARMLAVDLNRVPPQARAQVAAQLERLNRLQGPDRLPGSSLVQTGGFKTIAGYRCTVYRVDALSNELCVAHPESSFLIPASPMNGAVPGLLLEEKSPVMTLHAEEVRMYMAASKSVFAIPSGVTVTNVRVPSRGAVR